jgi:deoxyribose-phosphate aldolase
MEGSCVTNADLPARFAKLFDHSIVRPDATLTDVLSAAETAAALHTASLTVQPHYIVLGRERLLGSGVLLGTVVGFPHGNETPAMKRFQARTVMELGAQEIDMVMNIPSLKNGERALFIDDISGVVQEARGAKVKVILENAFLTDDEKRRACDWIARAGAHFVKTSTAYAEGGATLEDVRLMYAAVAGRCLVKAAGGVRTLNQVLHFLQAGARRFGSTRSDQFVQAFGALAPEQRAAYAAFLPAVESATIP